MRRFRFVGNPDEYGKSYSIGNVYEYSFKPKEIHDSVGDSAEFFPEDWEEIFDEPKPLHKDTDLGWAVSVLLRSGWNIHEVVKDAKELIKQLDKERK